MTTVQLHTNTLPPTATVVQALLQALQDVGLDLQVALERADRARATALSGQVLQQVSKAWAAQVAVPVCEALVQALVLEVAFRPLTALGDGTLVDDCLDVWLGHRAWQVRHTAMPALFGQLVTGLVVAGQPVSWSCEPGSQGRTTVQVWAALDV